MPLSIALSPQEQKGNVVLDTETLDNDTIKTLPKACLKEVNVYAAVDKSLQCGKKTQTSKICAKRKKGCLMSRSTTQGMIRRLLIENKMPKEKLAKILAIRKKQVEYFAAKLGSEKLRAKINLPLIKLYCKTRWKQE
jgi:hypothetical protein